MLTALAFLVIFFAIIILALVKKPIYGIYAYLLAFYAFPPGQWWGKVLPDLRWSLLASAVTLIAVLRQKDKVKLFAFRETKIYFVFFIYLVLQMLWIDRPDIHKEFLVLTGKLLLLFYLLQNSVRTTQDLVGFVTANLIGCSYYAYVGMFQHTGGRLEGIGTPGMESANQLGQHIIVILLMGSFLLLGRLKKFVLFLYPLVGLTLNALMLTASRGAILGFLAGGLFSVIFIPPQTRMKMIRYGALGIFAVAALAGPQIYERFASMAQADNAEQDKSAESRMVIINAQIEMFANNPIFGFGHRGTLLQSYYYIPQEYLTKTTGGSSARASHNLTMALLVDHGIIGAGLYFIIVISCIRRLFLSKKIRVSSDEIINLKVLLLGLVCGLVGLMVASQGSNSKKLEIGIWLFALIPPAYNMLKVKAEELSQLSSQPEK